MKTFLLDLICISVFCFSVSCENETTTEMNDSHDKWFNDTHGCVSGTVTFFNTGTVTDAYVRLLLPGSQTAIYSCLINSHGDYVIDNVDTGNYVIRIFKQGFVDTVFSEHVYIRPKSLTNGECWKMDCAISMLPPRMTLLEVNTDTQLDTLDFGTIDTKLYFRICNFSSQTCIWTSDFDEVRQQNKWLKSMQPVSGSMKPNETNLVSVEINREVSWITGVTRGNKSAKFLIKSNNSGGYVLTVLAEIE